MSAGIYSIQNKITNKRYIGRTKDLKERKREHFHKLKINDHINTHLQNSYNLYGKDNFEFKTILICQNNQLDYYEDYFINYYNSLENGYNLCEGGLNNCPDNSNEKHGMWRKDIDNELIKRMYLSGKQSGEIAEIFGCSRRTIDRRLHKIFDDETIKKIANQRRSKSLLGKQGLKGEEHPNYDKNVPSPYELYKERLSGITQEELAKKYNTTQSTISNRICEYKDTLPSTFIRRNKNNDKLWDNFIVGYRKGDMVRGNRKPNPCNCFFLKLNGLRYYDISSVEWYSFELIADLVEEILQEEEDGERIL